MMCIDCFYWHCQRGVKQVRHPEKGTKFGDCSCSHFVYTGDGCPSVEGNELLYYDAEGYSAHFETGEYFGCIHFEKKRT